MQFQFDFHETWKNIPNYEGFYQASTLGRIKALGRIVKKSTQNVFFPERILFGRERNKGQKYVFVSLYKDGVQRQFFIHRLVALTYIRNPFNKPVVNHLNGIKNDNRLVNLEWCTYSENGIHAVKTGLQKPLCGEKNSQSKLTNADVFFIRNSRHVVDRKTLSTMFGVSIKHIDRVRGKERWRHI